MKTVTVHFMPEGKKVTAAPGDILVDIAMNAGVHINAACGGEGVCGKCRVVITSGEVNSPDSGILSAEEISKGCRLACQSRLVGDVEVSVPEEKPLEKAAVQGPRVRVPDGRQAVSQEIEKLVDGAWYNPALKKFFVELEPPTLSDNISDLSRLLRPERRGMESDRHRGADEDGIAAGGAPVAGRTPSQADKRGAGGHNRTALLHRDGHRDHLPLGPAH
jgi:uncharacterized 2Fe-2S/4Fe-4S cluster protein (DUF4445 family)